jgi:CMP-2-keto-3-deoxyoctulosonic acid synthetase
MDEERRVRLYWDDGTVETAHEPIGAEVKVIVRLAKDGTHRHFEVTDDVDVDGYVIAIELAGDM